MSRIALRNSTIVTMDPGRRVLDDFVLVVEDDRIAGLVPSREWISRPDDEIVDCRGRFVLPGFVNTHVHTVQQLARGLADDVDLMALLHDRIFPYESSILPEDSYFSSLLFGIEQIMNGTTAFADAGLQHAEPTVKAVEELGLRGAFCRSITDIGDGLPESWKIPAAECIALQEDDHRRFHGAAGGRVRWWFGLRTLFNNSDDLIVRTAAAARSLGTCVHMHVAQSPGENAYSTKTRGATTVRHLAELGLLGENLLAVHCIHTDPEEVDLLAMHGVKVSHSPGAGLKIMGLPRIAHMLERGIVVGLATDSGASNNRNSMPDEMWLATLVQKGAFANPALATAQQILAMATIDAARCLGWDAEVGSIEVGKKADLCVINPWTPNMQPMHDPVANLVFCMKTENVESTMCNGVWLMRNRQLTRIDVDEVLKEVRERSAMIRSRAGIALTPRFPRVTPPEVPKVPSTTLVER